MLQRDLLDVLGPVLYYYELQRQSDLRRRQAHSRRVTHGVAHRFDQVLDGPAHNFLRRKWAGRLAQNLFSSLQDFERHFDSLMRSGDSTLISTPFISTKSILVRPSQRFCETMELDSPYANSDQSLSDSCRRRGGVRRRNALDLAARRAWRNRGHRAGA